MKKLTSLVALLGLILTLLAAVAWPLRSEAATLSGGSYTYVVDGEEMLFAYDPIVKSGSVLLPLEVFTSLGITVDGALEKEVTLKSGPVTVGLTVGRPVAQVGLESQPLAIAPVRLNGRLFLPAELLEDFGINFSQEGNYVSINRYATQMPELVYGTPGEWQAKTADRSFSTSVRADSGFVLSATFTLLTEEILADRNLDMAYGTRARLMGLLETNSLVLVELSNNAMRSGALVTNGIYLVDADRNQYDVLEVLDIGDGLLSGKLAPAADRMGVLRLSKIQSSGPVKLYYENNGMIIGSFVAGE